jgi:hypothetical protein
LEIFANQVIKRTRGGIDKLFKLYLMKKSKTLYIEEGFYSTALGTGITFTVYEFGVRISKKNTLVSY